MKADQQLILLAETAAQKTVRVRRLYRGKAHRLIVKSYPLNADALKDEWDSFLSTCVKIRREHAFWAAMSA